jgi:small subunit ribosomal protein S4
VVHGHFTVNGQKVNIPSYRVSQHDIIDLVEKVREQTPHIVNRETHNERNVPGWLQVVPERGRIFVHQLPIRQQIVVDVQEQLIVELYSK